MVQRRAASPLAVIAVLGYCGALVSITQTVSLPLLPMLPEALDTSVSNVSWVATSSFLTGAVANPVLGRLGDMYGKRPVILGALVTLAVGCAISAVAPNVLVLVIGRALQGFGIAVVPLGMSVAKETLPPNRTSQGVALVSATLGIGGGLGLPLAGVVLDWQDWQAVFWVNAALTVVGLLLAVAVLPEGHHRESARFDVVGAVWLSAALVAVLLPLSKSADWGWLGPLPLGLYVLGFAGLIGWYYFEQRPARPLVDVTLMRERPLLIVNGTGLLLGFGMFSNMYAPITLLQTPDSVSHGFGSSVVAAGMIMLPGALAMMAMSPVSAWITDRFSSRASLCVGATVMTVGYVTRLWMLDSAAGIGISVAIVNGGIGIAYGAIPSAIMANVPGNETGSANAIGTLTRSSGASIGSAAIAAILSSLTVTSSGETLPSLEAFQLVFGLAAAASFIAALVSSRLPVAGPPRVVTVVAPGTGTDRGQRMPDRLRPDHPG